MLEEKNRTTTVIAYVAHEANRALCEAFGDFTQVPWGAAPGWQVESAINGVKFLFDNPLAGPADCHENWMREKLEHGWVYGETKDPFAKTHPCLVPYDELPPEQRAKDHLFHAIVRTLADMGQEL